MVFRFIVWYWYYLFCIVDIRCCIHLYSMVLLCHCSVDPVFDWWCLPLLRFNGWWWYLLPFDLVIIVVWRSDDLFILLLCTVPIYGIAWWYYIPDTVHLMMRCWCAIIGVVCVILLFDAMLRYFAVRRLRWFVTDVLHLRADVDWWYYSIPIRC